MKEHSKGVHIKDNKVVTSFRNESVMET